MKTLSLFLILLLTMIPMQSGQWNVTLQEPANNSLIAEPEPDPIDKSVKIVKNLARLSLVGMIIAVISLLIAIGASIGLTQILVYVVAIGFFGSFLLSFINVLFAQKVLKKLRALPPSEKNQQRLKITKRNQALSFIPFVGFVGFIIFLFYITS